MKNNSNFLLLILFALAICVVGWLGYQLTSQQDQQLKINQINRSEQTLSLIQNNINAYITAKQNHLAELSILNPISLQEQLDSDPLLNEVMIFDSSDQLIFPTTTSIERQKTSYQWLNNMAKSGEDSGFKSADLGWFVWYQQQKEQYVFWIQNEQLKIFVELNNAMFMADFIHWLSTQPNATDNAFLYISDNLGRIFYQWGDDSLIQADINIQKNLASPLTGWSVHFNADIDTLSDLSKRLFQAVVIGLLILISIITYMLYQIKRREQREAQQRLSFINQVSHELKTPLTNIRLHGELLERTMIHVNNDKKTQQSVTIIQQESERLTRLINNVLNFNSVEKNSLKLVYSEINFDDLLDQSIRPFLLSFEQLNINILLQNEVHQQVHVDIDIVKQIIGNLLSNVEKYAANSEQVTLTSKQDSGFILITVQDQGSGISHKNRDQIFDPFYRINSDLTHASGSGLGLGLARELARLHGGNLQLIPSQSGACFKLTIKVHHA